ncbi:hypothetical protein [Tardiphaga sp. 839_C3_N1_4]|uniref:hypothetical protein n=1 Tax=Tardiphaga sp. 839_C3_N1_4 TaxID=3240761 RepID=UPI003F1EB46F
MACHIYAASDGPAARRVETEKSIEELRSIENGIWMCYRHGKIIDTDEFTFGPQTLMGWRRLAERRAKLRHELGRELTNNDLLGEALVEIAIELRVPEITRDIDEAFQMSALREIWGIQTALVARDFVVELGRNALTHGGATSFRLTVSAHSLILSDDGRPFSHTDLLAAESARGGNTSLKQMKRHAPDLVASYSRQGSENVTILASTSSLDEMLSTNQCTTDFFGAPSSIMAAMKFVEGHSECGTIFLRPTFGALGYSDLENLASAIKLYELQDRDIALILGLHSNAIYEFIAEKLPFVRVIKSQYLGTI